jgi:hypothetical protein
MENDDDDYEFGPPDNPWEREQREKEGDLSNPIKRLEDLLNRLQEIAGIDPNEIKDAVYESMPEMPDGIYYMFVDGKIKIPESRQEYYEWMEKDDGTNRRVELSVVEKGVEVSTVFLAINHAFSRDEKPILFESMVFDSENKSKLDQFQWRYKSLGDAKMGHYEIVNAIREGREPEIKFGEEGFFSRFRDEINHDDDSDNSDDNKT